MSEEGEFWERHRDPVWRLNHLYWVKEAASGQAVPFKPKAEQRVLIEAVYERGERNILVPKARQLGISTVISLIILDCMLFFGGVQAAIIDLTQPDATKKLRNKILFAFEHLPEVLRGNYEVLKSNDHVFSVRLLGSQTDGESEVQAGMNARGDTFQVLMVSEWGKIAWTDPIRSQEILTGALPAAKKGIRFVETTWKGAKQGDLWRIMKRAMETKPEDMTEEDFHLYFFPWWGDPDYSLGGNAGQIDEQCGRYLDEVELEIGKRRSEGFGFTPGQRLWYYKVAWAKGLFRFEEYPSLLEECFRAPVEGAIYADLLDRLRTSGGMVSGAVDRNLLVHTSWDLGSPVNTVVWYFQLIGAEIRVIDIDHDEDLTPAERVARILSKGYLLGWHYLPHDAVATQKSGRTFLMELKALGLANLRVVPKTMDVWVGINHLRGLIARFSFRVPECERGLEMLAAYHTKRETAGGTALDIPVHDACFVSDTQVLTDYGMHPICEASQSGHIWTQFGWRRYHNLGITRRNALIVEVRFSDGLTVRCTPDHLFMMESGWRFAAELHPGFEIQSCLMPSPNFLMDGFTGRTHQAGITMAGEVGCTESYGRQLSGKFHQDATFTIGTETLGTIAFRIWNVSTAQSIIEKSCLDLRRRARQTFPAMMHGEQRQSGTVLSKAGFGIASTPGAFRDGRSGSESSGHACIVAGNSLRSFEEEEAKNTVRKPVRPCIIESVRKLREAQDVWCLSVPGIDEFCLINGAIVHNSSHYADALRVLAEAEAAGMLGRSLAGGVGQGGFARTREVRVRTGFRGDGEERPAGILDRFFGPERGRGVRVIR